MKTTAPPLPKAGPPRRRAFLVDLIIYISVMFLVREVYFPEIGFIANGLMWSLTTLAVATWRMKARGISWKDLGLRRPESYGITLIATVAILGMAIMSVVVFELVKDQLAFGLTPEDSGASAVSRFGDLQGNWLLFLTIIPFVWIESLLEELLDRGFLMNWIERMLPNGLFATVSAVVTQAAIFGFRHSYDLSERSITVGLIGLAMGVGYVVFGRNLWPLIVAHCVLNTLSMLDRVT
ncbi:MAG TPA: CPBP family intramembrane glutamic endopeptidase [Acidobacteriota bacterium]|nr:CPBP family intramembrane glutamic endopeptidase [Acidobacteriota bacterium]